MAVFEPLLGIKSEENLKAMSLANAQHTIRARIKAGVLRLQGITAEALLHLVIPKSASSRYVSWKDAFIDALGESRATEVQQQTPETFSYKLVLP